MTTRRRFLGTVGTGLATAPLAYAQASAQRRTRLQMLFNDDPISQPRHKPEPACWSDSTITAAWLGQSTILLNFFGMWIITDPVLSDRIGLNIAGLFTIGPKRLVYPALQFDEIPPVDLLLLSHAHMDHLDIPTLRRFDRNTPIVMAKYTSDVIEDLDFKTVYELDWGTWTSIGGLRVEALEVRHFGWRYPWEQDRSRGYPEGRSYNAYLLSKNGHHIVFGGDSAYQENFRRLRERRITIDLAMMPIGAYDPWIFNHANPEQALAMADHMGAYHILPMHWSTFIQSEEPIGEPIERLKRAAAMEPDRIVLDEIGKTWVFNQTLAGVEAPADPSRPPIPKGIERQ